MTTRGKNRDVIAAAETQIPNTNRAVKTPQTKAPASSHCKPLCGRWRTTNEQTFTAREHRDESRRCGIHWADNEPVVEIERKK